MIDIEIKLTSVGADAGPFEITSDGEVPAFSYVYGTFSAAALLAGVTLSFPDTTTVVRVTSTGICTNKKDVPVDVPATTTTTTTAAPVSPATIDITNSSLDLVISAVSVNYIGITDATLPVYTAQTTSGNSSQLGTHPVMLFVSGNILADQSLKIIDSVGNISCKDYIGAGSYMFYNIVVNNSTPVQVFAQSVSCSATTTTTSSTTTTTTTAPVIPVNALTLAEVGIPNTTIDYSLILSNTTGAPITYRLRIENVTQGSGWHVGPQHIVAPGTTNELHQATITAFGVGNVNGDTINAELSDDDGLSWVASLIFDPPHTLPYALS